jgi:hypothetical protein
MPLDGIKENSFNWLMESELHVPNYSLNLMDVGTHLLINIIWFMESVMFWPIVIPLSNFHCIIKVCLQLAPLNVITVNVINWPMESN